MDTKDIMEIAAELEQEQAAHEEPEETVAESQEEQEQSADAAADEPVSEPPEEPSEEEASDGMHGRTKRRFDQLLEERKAQREELDALKAQMDALKGPAEPQKEVAAEKPSWYSQLTEEQQRYTDLLVKQAEANAEKRVMALVDEKIAPLQETRNQYSLQAITSNFLSEHSNDNIKPSEYQTEISEFIQASPELSDWVLGSIASNDAKKASRGLELAWQAVQASLLQKQNSKLTKTQTAKAKAASTSPRTVGAATVEKTHQPTTNIHEIAAQVEEDMKAGRV